MLDSLIGLTVFEGVDIALVLELLNTPAKEAASRFVELLLSTLLVIFNCDGVVEPEEKLVALLVLTKPLDKMLLSIVLEPISGPNVPPDKFDANAMTGADLKDWVGDAITDPEKLDVVIDGITKDEPLLGDAVCGPTMANG